MVYKFSISVIGRKREWNKAVYTTASVAYGWAGAALQVSSPSGVFLYCVIEQQTDRPTDRPADRQTDKGTCRVASSRLKRVLIETEITL